MTGYSISRICCVWYEQISMISRLAWLNNLVVHVQYLCEGFASKRSSHTCIVFVCRYMLMYVCVFVCMYVCMYVCMHFHDDVHITHTYVCTHACTRTNMHARVFGALWRPCSLGRTCMCIHTYACVHMYICTRIYRTMWWPSWWGRTHVWEQTALCCCWIPLLLRVLHRSSLLTSGELTYMRVCMYVYVCCCWVL